MADHKKNKGCAAAFAWFTFLAGGIFWLIGLRWEDPPGSDRSRR